MTKDKMLIDLTEQLEFQLSLMDEWLTKTIDRDPSHVDWNDDEQLEFRLCDIRSTCKIAQRTLSKLQGHLGIKKQKEDK